MTTRTMAFLQLPISTLVYAINLIFFVRPKKQVAGIAALGRVALMANEKTVWYLAVEKTPRDAIGAFEL